MAEQEHPWDGISDDLFDWMQGEVSYYVEALRGGSRSPFSAPVSEQEKLEYYRRQMFQTKPDGTVEYDKPNKAGRDTLLKQLGTTAYAQVYETVRPKQGIRPSPSPEPDSLEAEMPVMPEDTESVL